MRLGVDARVLTHEATGVARYLAGLLDHWPELRTADDRLELFVDQAAVQPLPGHAESTWVRRWPLPGGDPAWRQVRLAAAVRRRKLDLLFCPFYTVPLLSRVPSVVTIHDVSFAAHPEWFRRRSRLAFSLAAPSARRARLVLTPSRFSADEIQRHLGIPAKKIEVTPLGLAPLWLEAVGDDERRQAREWLGWDGEYLLHLGAVHARRNVDRLVEAFGLMARERPELRLVIGGPDLDSGARIARLTRELGCADQVIRRPWIPEERLRGLLAEASVLAYLSSYEGFGIPALEAMACGVPVLALRRASLPEVLGDAALWVDEPEPAVVSEGLREVLRAGGCAKDLVAAGRKRASQFTWKACAARTFSLLRSAAALGSPE